MHLPYVDTPERRVLDLRRDGLTEVPLLGRYSYSHAHFELPIHCHSGVLEICYLGRGRQFFKCVQQEYYLSGGDVVVIQPGQPHGTGGHFSEPGLRYWLNLRLPRPGGRLLSLPAHETRQILDNLGALPRCRFCGSNQIGTLFRQLFAWHDRPQAVLRSTHMRVTVLQLLLEIIHCSHQDSGTGLSPLMTEVVALIESQPQEEFRLEDLARRAGLSLSHFKVRFRAETGVSPRQFILRSKIVIAKKRLLAGSDSITQIAMDLGFPTSQYFATVFKRFLGQTPKTFRQEGETHRRLSRHRTNGQG